MNDHSVSRRTTWAGVALVAVGLAACGGGADDEEPSVPGANALGSTAEASPTPDAETTTGAAGPTSGGDFSAANALAAIASAEADGGVVHDLDRTDDDSAWELDVVRDGVEHDVDISPDGATVLEENEEGDVDADDQAEHDAADVTISEAIEVAAAGRAEPLEGASLDEDDGTLVWSVEFEAGDDDVEVRVDAADGAVLGTES